METDDCADVLRALLAQGRGFPPLGAETDDRSTTLSGVPFAAYGGMGGWQMREAERLYHAECRRLPEMLVSRRRNGLSLHNAYRVQWYGVALRVREGARVVGHKVGLTSRAMQDQVGIDTPDSGILLDYMAVPPGEPLRAAELLSPRIEAEIAFRLGTDLCGTDVAEQAARGAVAEAFLALEVIDSRFHRDDITLADSVADNAAGARFVLGEAVPMPSWDLRAERLTVRTGTTPVAAGAGRDVLGDPVRSVVWLARHLAAFGTGLNLTPSGGGTMVAPTINGHRAESSRHLSLVSCGGQAVLPVLNVVARHCTPRYIEVVTTVAAASVGRATLLNLDEYIATTEYAMRRLTQAPDAS